MKKSIGGYFRELIDYNGTQSSGRFAFLLQVVFSNVAVWYSWLFVCIWTRTIVDIPVGVYTVYGIANGVAFAGKVGQSATERQSPNTSVTTEVKTQSIVEDSK